MGASAGKCNACHCAAEEVNASAVVQQAALDEIAPEDKGDPKEAMQIKINAVLAKGGLTFMDEKDTLTASGDWTVVELSELLKPFPEMPLKVVSFSSRSCGTMSEAHDLKQLTLQRARVVRTALQRNGCENKMGAEGLGFVDQKGERSELTICDVAEVDRVEARALAWERAEENRRAWAARVEEKEEKLKLQVVFVDDHGQEHSVQFSKKPVGFGFEKKVPIVVTSVDGHAREKGVQKGWQVREINGVGLRDKGFTEVFAFLREQSLTLPDPELAASQLPPINTFEVLFKTQGDATPIFCVSKRPLGLAYKNTMPLVVTRVEGHALELGVEAGWQILEINGESMEGKLHFEATWHMQVCLARLKPALV